MELGYEQIIEKLKIKLEQNGYPFKPMTSEMFEDIKPTLLVIIKPYTYGLIFATSNSQQRSTTLLYYYSVLCDEKNRRKILKEGSDNGCGYCTFMLANYYHPRSKKLPFWIKAFRSKEPYLPACLLIIEGESKLDGPKQFNEYYMTAFELDSSCGIKWLEFMRSNENVLGPVNKELAHKILITCAKKKWQSFVIEEAIKHNCCEAIAISFVTTHQTDAVDFIDYLDLTNLDVLSKIRVNTEQYSKNSIVTDYITMMIELIDKVQNMGLTFQPENFAQLQTYFEKNVSVDSAEPSSRFTLLGPSLNSTEVEFQDEQIEFIISMIDKIVKEKLEIDFSVCSNLSELSSDEVERIYALFATIGKTHQNIKSDEYNQYYLALYYYVHYARYDCSESYDLAIKILHDCTGITEKTNTKTKKRRRVSTQETCQIKPVDDYCTYLYKKITGQLELSDLVELWNNGNILAHHDIISQTIDLEKRTEYIEHIFQFDDIKKMWKCLKPIESYITDGHQLALYGILTHSFTNIDKFDLDRISEHGWVKSIVVKYMNEVPMSYKGIYIKLHSIIMCYSRNDELESNVSRWNDLHNVCE